MSIPTDTLERKRIDNLTHGEMVRVGREMKKMTLRQLAAAVGLSAPFLSDVEHNRRRLTGETLTKVADALGMSRVGLQRAAMFEAVKAKYPELAELLERGRRCKHCRGDLVFGPVRR